MIHFNTVLLSQPKSYEWFFPSPFPIKILCTRISCPPCVPHGPSISFFLIWSLEEWKHGARHYSILSGLLLLPTSYTSPFSLSIFKYIHLLPRLSSTTILKIPTLLLSINTSSGVSCIESFTDISLSQFVFHCVTAHKFWLHLNFLCAISFTFKVMSEIKSHANRNGFLASCYSRSFLWWQKQPHLGVFMAHGPASINMLSCLVVRMRNPGGVVSVIPRLRAGRPRNRGSIPGRCNRIFSFKICQVRHWGSSILLFNGYRFLLRSQSGRRVQMTHRHLVTGLGMGGVLSSLPIMFSFGAQ